MVNALSGLLGGISGAAGATYDVADTRQKQLAEMLKMEAIQRYAEATNKADHGYRTAENEQKGRIDEAIHKGNRASTEKIATDRSAAEEKIHRADNDARSGDRRYEADLRHQDRQEAIEQRKLEREAIGSKGIYSNVFHQADAEGNMVAFGVRRDTGEVEPLNVGGPKDNTKSAKAQTEAIEKFREAMAAGDYESARAIASINKIPTKETDEIVKKNWFSKDETRKRPEIDSAGLLSNKTGPTGPATTPDGEQTGPTIKSATSLSTIQAEIKALSGKTDKPPAPAPTEVKQAAPEKEPGLLGGSKAVATESKPDENADYFVGRDGETIWKMVGDQPVRVMPKPPEKLYNDRYPNPEYAQYLKLLEKARPAKSEKR